MKKEFVSYDIALALKELGFDEPCVAVYFGEYEERDFDNGIALEYRQSQYYAQKGWFKGLLAPLYQQAFRWFRSKNIEFQIVKNYPSDYGYDFQIKVKNKWNTYIDYETYEEAQDACLKKLIEIWLQRVAVKNTYSAPPR